jgi:hypothetical protein
LEERFLQPRGLGKRDERDAPRAFLRRSSKHKELFVLGFVRRLHESEIAARVDLWEMRPGDSLAGKAFEEGLGQS